MNDGGGSYLFLIESKNGLFFLKIYYGILFVSFVTVGLVSLLLTLLSLWTNMMLFLYLLLLFFLGLGE